MTAAYDKGASPPPRAPSQPAWDAMTATERASVLETLTASMREAELHPPEGDLHYDTRNDVRDTLRTYFGRTGRGIYVSAELTVYYPDEPRFAPDVLAVTDVAVHPRTRWVVSAEGKGIDWVLDVLVLGDRRKDLEQNVVRVAALGIPEYFILDVLRGALRGYRLPSSDARHYEAIVLQHGALPSRVLGLDLLLQDKQLRFRRGNAELLATREIIARLEAFVGERMAAAEDAERRLGEESRLREEESRLREAAEQRVAALLAENERLRRG